MTPSLIKKISLTFFLGGSCFFKPAFSSDDPSDVFQPPIAGYAAQVNHPTLHLPKTPAYYQNLLWKRKQAEEEFQKIIEETLNAAPDVIYELKHKIKEKKERLSLPEEFLKECVEALDLLTKGQPDDLAAFLDTSKLTPLQEALNYLKEFQEKWEVISSHVNSLTLALDQSLQDQKAWDALFNQENLTTIQGHDLYHWFAAFQKTLMALNSATSDFSQRWGPSYHPLFGKKNVLTNFYSAKNTLLWELGKAFIGSLPDYNDSLIHSELSGDNPLLAYPPKEPLETNWLLKSKFYSAWFDYFTHMNDYPPAFIDLPKMSDADKETGRRLFAKVSLEKEEENTLHALCENVIKYLWDPWKASMQKLSVLSDDALLGTLYPQEEPNSSYAFLLKLLKFIELWNQPIKIPVGLVPKLKQTFSLPLEWEKTVINFKDSLKPFTNTQFITSLCKKLYTENGDKTNNPLAPFAICTLQDGKRLRLPQSSVCETFPELEIYRNPQNIGGLYELSLLATLFGLPTQPFTLCFFEDIFRESCSKDLKEQPVSTKNYYALLQKKFRGYSLKDFPAGIPEGKSIPFDQMDADSLARHDLFHLITEISLPPENWGLIQQENGKFGLMMVGENLGNHFLQVSASQSPPSALLQNSFHLQDISDSVKQEFLAHDMPLLLSHWLMALAELQDDFHDRKEQEKRANPPSETNCLISDKWGLEFKALENQITKWITNFHLIKELLQGEKNIPTQKINSRNNLVPFSSMQVEVVSSVDMSQPHEQIIDTLARLFQVKLNVGETTTTEKCWKAFCQKIAQSENQSLIRRFFSISPKLLDYLGSEFPSFKENTFWITTQDDEFKMYPSRLSRSQKENQDAETQAADSFYALWGDDMPLLRPLLDLFLLPRYAATEKLSEELEKMSGYLTSTGFASHPLSSQHVGRSKSSQTGPVSLIAEDGQYYCLAWSEYWINAFRSPDPIPSKTREAILNHNMPLLALIWLQQLQTQNLPVTFYPWFIRTFLEKATKMQKILKTNPLSTFSEVMEPLWPPIYAILQHQFQVHSTPEQVSQLIENQVKQRQNLISLNVSAIDWDWIPRGGGKNLETILEDWVNEHGPNLSKPDPLNPHLSLTGAAGEILSYFIKNFTKAAYSLEGTEKILTYASQLGVDGTNMSFGKETILTILKYLIRVNQPEVIFDAQRFLISLYFQCSPDTIEVSVDSLKISGVHPRNTSDLVKIISLYPAIRTLDISDNGLKDLTFCRNFLPPALIKASSFTFSTSDPLRNLQTLDISRNPLWDPSPLRGTTPIQNIILSHTYIPGGDCFFYLTEWPQGGTSITNHFAVPPTAITSSSPQEERFFPTIHPDDAKGIISFYKNILKNICQDKKNPLFSGGGMTYYKCVLDIVNQMAQNFWRQTLADKEFSPNSKAALPHNEFVKTLSEPIESLFELVQRVFGSIAKGASGNPIIQIPEISRKWLFALENDLPCGIPPQDLICQPEPKYAYSLNDLNILQGTAQDYLDCLKRHWEYLKTDLSYEKELLSKTLESRLPLTLVTLAVNKLAQDFWHEALGMKPAGKPQDLWGILTVNNPIATLEAKKLAFAWAYGLPQGTIRDHLSISTPFTLAISNLAPNHHTLEFLKSFSHLTTLGLSYCNLESAKNLPVLHNLIELDLSHNSLESLWGLYTEDNPCFKFSNLKCLNLSHNQIKFGVNEWNGFAKSLQHLWQVDLSYNAIQIVPVMEQTQKTQQIKFNITHNSIPFSELWKLYDFKFFWQRSKEESRAITPKKNHHHPIHIFHENGQFFCQIYKNNKRKFKNPWDISSHEGYSIVQRLKDKRIDAPLELTDKDKKSLVELIVKENAGYLNTAHLRVIPQNVEIINNLK